MPGSSAPKQDWRAWSLAARRTLSSRQRAAEARALASHAAGLVDALALPAGALVCGYGPLPDEPGSLAMVNELRAAGLRVLLPVVDGERLDWVEYAGADAMRTGRFGIAEPIGKPLGHKAITNADAVIVPALAVDMTGVRLGRGRGYYDRALADTALPDTAGADTALDNTAPSRPIVAVIRDDELVDALPREPHDVPVSAVLTPTAGLRHLS